MAQVRALFDTRVIAVAKQPRKKRSRAPMQPNIHQTFLQELRYDRTELRICPATRAGGRPPPTVELRQQYADLHLHCFQGLGPILAPLGADTSIFQICQH